MKLRVLQKALVSTLRHMWRCMNAIACLKMIGLFYLQVPIPLVGGNFEIYSVQVTGKCTFEKTDMIWSLVPPCRTTPHKFTQTFKVGGMGGGGAGQGSILLITYYLVLNTRGVLIIEVGEKFSENLIRRAFY